jgi:hypothetical protein
MKELGKNVLAGIGFTIGALLVYWLWSKKEAKP